ncbi:MAG: anti-sigma F factor [Clostridia bacterium]|nr:anti-sigma F factor [Clostridia bacterium]
MKTNEIHINFPALSENEALARMCASSFAAQLNPTIEELSDIRTAVSEAVTNAIIHAYNSFPLPVYMDMYIEDEVLKIVIRDTGKGIENVDEAMQPFYTTVPGEERSGMGFSVMQAFMDTLEVNSVGGIGTTVVMTKKIERVLPE